MRTRRRLAMLGLAALMAAIHVRLACAEPPNYERAIRHAVALLPSPPRVVAMIDATDAKPDVRATLLTLDAFIIRDGSVVYLVKQSAVVDLAAHGSRPGELMLAAIIWHEMAHVHGADERTARKAEEQIWTGFVRDQLVDALTGLRYLKTLDARSLEVIDHHQIRAGTDFPLVQNRVAVR